MKRAFRSRGREGTTKDFAEDGFADALRERVTDKQKARKIPKRQRLIGRPSLDKLFEKPEKRQTTRDQTVGVRSINTAIVRQKSPPSKVALLDDQSIDPERRRNAKISFLANAGDT